MQLFRFANPEYLYLLLLLPLLFLLWVLNEYRKRRALRRLGNIYLVQKLIPEMSKIRPALKFIFQIIAVSLAIILLARPQFGSKLEEVKRQDSGTRCKQLDACRRYPAKQA
jgi:Ca-activated chloride channel family protein